MATLTVAPARGVLTRRIGEYAALADLDDAMARAARQCGLAPASPTRLVDDDLLLLDADDHDRFFDISELRAWESILGNATDPGLRDAGLDASPREVRDAAERAIKRLEVYTKNVYGLGLATISVNTIGFDFAAGAEPDESDEES